VNSWETDYALYKVNKTAYYIRIVDTQKRKMNAVQLGFPAYQSQPFAFPYGNCEQSAWAPPLKSSRTPFPRINLTSTHSPPPPHFPPSFIPPQGFGPGTHQRSDLSSSVQQFFHHFEQNRQTVRLLDGSETKSEADDTDAKTFKDKYLESQIEINRLRSIIRNMEAKKPAPSKVLSEEDVKSLSWATINELDEHNLIA
jgi:hypothetical protein